VRNLLSTVPKTAHEKVAAFVRTVFYQPDHATALGHLNDLLALTVQRLPPSRFARPKPGFSGIEISTP